MTRLSRLSVSIRTLLTALALQAGAAVALKADEPAVFADGGLALGGFDVVAYFTHGRPVPGQPENALKWRGAVWLFSSPEALMAFEMNPRAYAPRFGGYCAVGVAHGQLVPSDPAAFAIHDGRLYLVNSPEVLARWQSDPADFIAAARTEWPALIGR